MTVTSASFRATFPEFANPTRYPNAMLDFWLAFATRMVNADRWAEMTDMGVSLVLAHNVSLAAQADRQATYGKVPGGTQGVLTSKSVDGVSAGYDVSMASEEGAGNWNLTTYGARFYRLSQMMGMGPVQLGYDEAGIRPGAWAGPYFYSQ